MSSRTRNYRGIFQPKGSRFLWVSYAGPDGTIIRTTTKSTKIKDAQVMLEECRKAIRDGKNPDMYKKLPNITFAELAEKYLHFCKHQGEFKSKRGFIKQLVNAFGNMPLKRIDTQLVEQYQRDRTEKGNVKATSNRHLATLNHMFTKALDWDLINEQIVKRVRKVKLFKGENKRDRFLSIEECQQLINACDLHIKPIVITALNTGMRKGEILSLEWRHIDLQHGFISLQKTKNGGGRQIPINDDLRGELQRLIRRLDIPFVFFDPATGRRYKDVRRRWKTAKTRAGILDFRFHDLRHTFASLLVMAGVDITTVSKLLGHKSLTMTLRYAHLAPKHLQKAVNVLNFSEGMKVNTSAYLLHSQ